ncbi:MAG TPA: hypothetical protein VNJ08_00555 [Bacteriovoracaceae bacterium]|nr:hypothetical protein [Bacteriovoracaceae bacterium]
MKLSWITIGLLFSLNVFAEKMQGPENSPFVFNRIMGTETFVKFSDLPLSGKLADDRMGWSETYWPSNIGGIGYRWNHPNPEPFKYKLLSKEEIMAMTPAELAQLSPAELYDISQGDYSYQLTRATRVLYKTTDLWWEGICHGWSQASTNYPEPAPVRVKNPDGIMVPFGSSDIKGLMAMHYAYLIPGKYARLGKKCLIKGKVVGEEDSRDGTLPIPTEEQLNTPDCRDVNAGAFHVILTNMLGIHGKTFVADIDRLNDVWNQPIVGFSSVVVGEEAVTPEQQSYGVTRAVRVQSKMTYGEELQIRTAQKEAEHPEWIHWVSKKPVTGTLLQQFRHKNYEYIVELDGMGRIVGGEWITSTRPDFLWAKERVAKFQNITVSPGVTLPLAGLNTIYRPIKM